MKLDYDKICGVIVIALMLAIFATFVVNSCNRPAQRVIENLEATNDSLVKEGQKLTQTLKESESKVVHFEQKSVELVQENIKLKSRIASLESQRRTIASEIDKLSSDTIYALLQEIYPAPDTLKLYRFSPAQVKSIYITKIEHNNLTCSDSTYKLVVQNLEEQLITKDSVISQKDLQISAYKDKLDLKDGIIINKDDIIKYQEAEIKYQKRTKFFWQLGAGALGVVAVLIAL